MKRTLVAVLAGALMAASGACSDKKKSDDTSSKATVEGERGPQGKRGRRAPAMRAGRLQKRLGLTDEQTAKVETALAGAKTRAEQAKVLKDILTPEQFVEYGRMMMGRGKGRGQRDPATRAAMMKRRLGLSDEQEANMAKTLASEGTREERQEAMKAILTPEQLAKYEKMMDERRKRREERGMRGRPDRPGEPEMPGKPETPAKDDSGGAPAPNE